MFTGLIQGIGIVREPPAPNRPTVVESGQLVNRLTTGGSVAVEGVCLTAVKVTSEAFTADVSAETLRRTTLAGLNKGDRVNLEVPLTLDTPLGGHIVQGHVDGIGVIRDVRHTSQGYDFSFDAAPHLLKYIVDKGSVAIAGISLTVAACRPDGFDVAVVPYTYENTTLCFRRPGDHVNVEVDIVAKYVERLLSNTRKGLTEDRLRELGFA